MLLRQFIKDKPQILQYMQNSGDNELTIFNFIISILNSNIGIQVHTIIKMFNELTEIINKTINKDDYMYAIFKEKKQLFNIQRILLDKIIDNSGKEIYEKFCSNIMLILGGYLRPIYQNIYKSYYFTVADNFKDFSRRLKVEDKINKIEKRLKEANTILNVLKKRPTLFLNLRKNIVRPLNNLFSELDSTANEHISKYFEIKYKDNIVKSKFDENQFDILIKTLQVSINLGVPVSLSLIGSAVVSVANPHPLPDDALHKYIKYKQKYLLLKKRFENTK